MDDKLQALIDNGPGPAGGDDFYEIDGQQYERVTGILHKILPPYLVPWAENIGQEAAHTVMSQSQGKMPSLEVMRQEIKSRGLDAETQRDSGANRGLEAHLALEAYIKQGIVPNVKDFTEEYRPYAQALCQWLMDYAPEFECSEVTVWHPELGYAGTFDALGKVTKQPSGVRHPNIIGKRFAFDLKTNKKKRIYFPQHYFQLAAYDCALKYHGVEIDGSAVIAIGPAGSVAGRPYTVGVNFVQSEQWPPLVEAYRVLQAAQLQNPNGRK